MASTFEQMVEFLDTAWDARSFIVPCLVSSPGCGKTDAVRYHAEKHKVKRLVTIIASQILPNEVSGITMPDTERQAMFIYDHYRLSQLEDGDILFFDELLEADQMVLSACLTLIESRQLMSGTKLPDIQIIAATNATIPPSMLRTNIRQRFLFREFQMDADGCVEYIKKETGMDLSDMKANLEIDSTDRYNVLTPRSLTKMAKWITMAEDEEQAILIARQIDACWHVMVGDMLLEHWRELHTGTPEMLLREVCRDLVESDGVKDDTVNKVAYEGFEDITMTDLLMVLKGLEGWEEIETKLNKMTVSV